MPTGSRAQPVWPTARPAHHTPRSSRGRARQADGDGCCAPPDAPSGGSRQPRRPGAPGGAPHTSAPPHAGRRGGLGSRAPARPRPLALPPRVAAARACAPRSTAWWRARAAVAAGRGSAAPTDPLARDARDDDRTPPGQRAVRPPSAHGGVLVRRRTPPGAPIAGRHPEALGIDAGWGPEFNGEPWSRARRPGRSNSLWLARWVPTTDRRGCCAGSAWARPLIR